MILGLHHAAISTPDMERATDFYCRVLGGTLVSRKGWNKGDCPEIDLRLGLRESGAQVALVRLGAAFIEFFEYASPTPRPKDPAEVAADHGIRHVCFVVDDCMAEYERLLKLGMRFHAAPLRAPGGLCFTYGRDPDGNIIEILEIPKGHEFPNNYNAGA